ncbi:MAG: maltose ABC transporter substrate-binding protein [Acidimicrobiia bacterium]|nr:maltose ABC transporter substrate-binding protein [Acidimicrobiia bacterium]
MKNWKALLGLILAFSLIVAACGSDTTETTEGVAAPSTTAAPATTTTEAAPETTTTLADTGGTTTTTLPPVVRADADLVIWADDTRAPAITPFAEQFGADNGLTVAVQEVGSGQIRDRLIVAGPAGEGPDIIIGAHDWLGQLVDSGVVAPLDVSAVADQFSEASIQAFNYEGQIYGLPTSVENIALVRNVDLVPDAPATFEELAEVALALFAAGDVEVPLALQENGNGDPYHNYPLVTSYGGYVFGVNADGSYNPEDVGIDSEGGLAAAQAFSDYAASGLINVDVTYDIMTESFGNGTAPFAITGPWALPSFEGVNYVVEPIPPAAGGEPQPFIGVQGFMISAFAENPIFAQTFVLDFMSTQEAQVALFQADPRPPAHLGAFAEVSADNQAIQGFGLSGQNGYPMPAIPEMGSVWTAWTDAYELILTGGDPIAAFTDAAAQIRTLIAAG